MNMPKSDTQSPACGGGSKAVTLTFVQADSTCFRDLVQRLTGPSGNEINSPLAPQPAQRLHERRRQTKPELETPTPTGLQLQPNIPLSPPILNLTGTYRSGYWSYPASPSSVILSTPPISLQPSPISNIQKKRASPSLVVEVNPKEEEETAIKEKRFYLHPSPRSKAKLSTDPQLLPLFPLESPTGGGSGTN